MDLRGIIKVAVGSVLLAAAVHARADGPSQANRAVSAESAPPAASYKSVYEDSRAGTADARTRSTKIHRMLERELDRIVDGKTVKAWVLFGDKGVTSRRAYDTAVQELATKYNRRAIERRRNRRTLPGLFDEYDLEVVPAYVAEVEATGARVHVVSRWVNGVSVYATKAEFQQIERLPFVKTMQPVRRSRGIEPVGIRPSPSEQDARVRPGRSATESFYGESEQQLAEMNLLAVHDLGFTGKNVLVGILDTGFSRIHEAFNDPAHPVNIVAEWDFVRRDASASIQDGDPGDQHSHGTYILGTLGAYRPGELVGGAYDASFVVCKTENVLIEVPGEEDNYVGGLEFIEAYGADLATSSLGYVDWYDQADLDGLTAVTTIGANIATGNGLHLCNAAGNAGHDGNPTTSHLIAPSDGLQVIACGAVDSAGNTASFSSDGPSADGRVKPEVLARGVDTRTVNSNGTSGYSGVGGTSLSTPLVASTVACLVDAYPNWTVDKMREALFETADYYVANGTFDPLYVRGYGIVNALAALRADCNDNDLDDSADISGGGSDDCNGNGIPDECEDDCNGNGITDDCDLDAGTSDDCDSDGLLDECELDCDGDGTPDDCELDLREQDCNRDGVCNGLEIADCRADTASCGDCNENGIPDQCDITTFGFHDFDRDGVPDECVRAPLPAAAPHDVRKHRYVTIDPTGYSAGIAFEVTVAEMRRCSIDNGACDADEDCVKRCSTTGEVCEVDDDCPGVANLCVAQGCEDSQSVGLKKWVGGFWDPSCEDEDWTPNGELCTGELVARLVSTPLFRDWSENLLHIGDCEIVPSATYEVRATMDGVTFSPPLVVGTIHRPGLWQFGDAVGVGTGALPPMPGFTGPNGVVNVTDIQAFQLTAQGDSSPSVHSTWVDLHGLGAGSPPNFVLNVADIQRIKFGFLGQIFTDVPEQLDPADCP